MTIEVTIPDALRAAFLACSVLSSRPLHVCTQCFEASDDVQIVDGSRNWPCRPCRRENERARQRRLSLRLCTVARCTNRPTRLGSPFCAHHRPRFG